MSNPDPDRPRNAILFSEKLLGLKADCNIPYCREWESSTGWLLYSVVANSWFIEFKCPDHGPDGGTWRPEWQLLIEEVIGTKTKEGFDIAAAVQALRDGRK